MHKSVVSRTARLGKLFFSMLYISSFTFGGGFVIATFMKKKFVDELHWIDEKEMCLLPSCFLDLPIISVR